MNQAIEYLKAFALFIAVAVVSGVIVMKIAMISGGEAVQTPDIRGKEIIAALETLSATGLHLKVNRLDFDATIPKDRIVSQEPEAGESLKRGRDVRVIVSRGSKEALTPDLVSSSLFRAETILNRNDIKIRKRVYIHSDKPKGEILAQKPPPRTSIIRGDAVSLLVSSGPFPEYIMAPDFVERRLESVMDKIKELDLKISRVAYEASSQTDRGVVIRQDPPFGARIEKGSFIALTVSEGVAPENDQPATYTFLYYTVPDGPSAVKVSITQENRDGEKEVYNRVHRPGDTVSLLVEIKGRTVAKIFLDNELAEARRF